MTLLYYICCSPIDRELKDFTLYKMYLLLFGFINGMYEKVFKVRTCGWFISCMYIRKCSW